MRKLSRDEPTRKLVVTGPVGDTVVSVDGPDAAMTLWHIMRSLSRHYPHLYYYDREQPPPTREEDRL